MTRNDAAHHFVAGPDGRQAYEDLSAEYHQTLSSPLDDMWASFADDADPVAIMVGDELAGCASIDQSGALHRFFVRCEFDHRADDLFHALVEHRSIDTAFVATVDPGLLSVAVPRTQASTTVALIYRRCAAPTGGSLDGLRHGAEADHGAVVAFMISATGAPQPWLDGYIAERIGRGELFIYEDGGRIGGVGECREDRRASGNAHLGLVIGVPQRSRGLGTKLMNALVERCERNARTPLCSTEPGNHAARKLIRRAGFRTRHRIFRLDIAANRQA